MYLSALLENILSVNMDGFHDKVAKYTVLEIVDKVDLV